jgi:hypothetical protein
MSRVVSGNGPGSGDISKGKSFTGGIFMATKKKAKKKKH